MFKITFFLISLFLASSLTAQPDFSQSKPTNTNPANLLILSRDGKKQQGRLLYVTDTSLVIWQSREPYDARHLDSHAAYWHYSEIDKFVHQKPVHVGRGMLYGAVIGFISGAIIGYTGGEDEVEGITTSILMSAEEMALIKGVELGVVGVAIGGIIGGLQGLDNYYTLNGSHATFRSYVPWLKENSMLILPPTPEPLNHTIQQEIRISAPAISDTTNQVSINNKHLLKESPLAFSDTNRSGGDSSLIAPAKFHFNMNGAWIFTSGSSDMIEAFNHSGFHGEYGVTQPVRFTAGGGYSLIRPVRLVAELDYLTMQEVLGDGGASFATEFARETSFGLLVDWTQFPVTEWLISRSEFTVGAGVGYHLLKVNGNLSFYHATLGNTSVTFKEEKSVPGARLRASLDYYLIRAISVQFKLEGRWLPSLKVPEVVLHYQDFNKNGQLVNYTKILKKHEVNFSSLDLLIGFQLHL